MPAYRDKPWFAAKRFGYGSGLPVAWEGWLVLALYTLAILASVAGLTGAGRFLAIVGATALLMLICARRTEGGWR
jgi:hypothetical protein